MNDHEGPKHKENQQIFNEVATPKQNQHVQGSNRSHHSRQSTPNSNLREPLVQILNDSEFSSPVKANDASSILEKLEFSGNNDFPHFSQNLNQQAATKLSKKLQARRINIVDTYQKDDKDVPCTPLSQVDQKIRTLQIQNQETSQNVIFDGDDDDKSAQREQGFFIKDEYFAIQRNFAKSVSDKLLTSQQFNEVQRMIDEKALDKQQRDEGSLLASQDCQSETIGQESKACYPEARAALKAPRGGEPVNNSKAKKAPRHESGIAGISKKPRQSIPLYQNKTSVATAQINLKSHRKNAKKNKSTAQVVPQTANLQKTTEIPKLQKHNSHRQMVNNKTTPERSVLVGYQKNLASKALGFRNSFTQESKGLNQSGSKTLNNTITPRLQKEKQYRSIESQEHSKELVRRTSPQVQEEESSKKAPVSLRTACKKSVTDYSQIMLTNSRNFNTKHLDTKSSLPSVKNANLEIKSECGSQLNQELLERMSSQKLFDTNDTDHSNNIKVVIRVRPFNQREIDDLTNRSCVEILSAGTQIKLELGQEGKVFNFDFVGDPSIDQMSIFNHIARPIADSCMQGYNGTIFAYGQTGAGKTYTIQGPSLQSAAITEDCSAQNVADSQSTCLQEGRGIMQRSFEYIFQCIQAEKLMVLEKENGSALQFLVKCSFLEIYNEQIIDLLDTNAVNLNIREDINKGVYVEGLSEEIVTSEQDMLELILKGSNNRHVGATNMNRSSSRSHSVLTTIIESKSRSATGVWNVKQSRFHIIDLAGSERQKVAKTVGDRLKEAGMINKSLSALGNVINSLVDVSEGKNRHIPYRDSKLTFILRDSLGGNSRTAIIANISPSHLNISETLSTLKFAQRAKLIKNKAVINEDSSGTIVLLKNEIKKLKKELTDQVNQVVLLQNEKQNLKDNIAQFSDMQKSIINQGVCKICKQEDAMNCIDFSQLIEANAADPVDVLVYSQQSDSSIEGGKVENRLSNLQIPSTSDSHLKAQKNQKELVVGLTGFESQNKLIQRKSHEQQYREKLLQERVIRAEKLMNHRLLEHSGRQKIIRNLEAQVKKLTAALELRESDISKMKTLLDAKDELIKQLEDQSNFDEEDIATQYRKEIEYLKEIIRRQIDKEETPETLTMKAQLEELAVYKDAVTALGGDGATYKDVMTRELESHQKMIDELNEYINSKCSMQLLMTTESNLNQVKAQKEKLETQEKELNEQIEQLQQKFEGMQEQNMEIDQKCQTVTRDLARAKLEIQNSKNQFKQYEKTISLKQSEIDQKQQEIQKLKKEFKSQLDELDIEHRAELLRLNQEKTNISDENAELQSKLTKALLQVDDTQKQLDGQKAGNEEILKQLDHKTTQNEDTRTQLEKSLALEQELRKNSLDQKDQLTKLDLKYNLLEKLVSEKSDQIDSKNDQLCKKNEQIEKLNKEQNQLQQQLDQINSDYKAADDSLQKCLTEKDNLQHELNTQQQISIQYDQSIKKQNEEMQNLMTQIADLNKQVQAIELEKHGLHLNVDSQNQQIAEIKAHIDLKEKQLKEHQSQIEELNIQKQENKKMNDKLQQELEKNQALIDSYEREKESQLQKIASLDSEIQQQIRAQSALENELQTLKMANEDQRTQVVDREKEIVNLQSQSQKLENNNKMNIESMSEQLKAQQEDFETRIKDITQKLTSREEKLQEQESQHLLQMSQYNQSIEEYKSEIAALTSKNDEQNETINKLNNQYTETENKQNQERTQLQETITQNQDQHRQQSKKIQELLLKLQGSQSEIQKQKLDLQTNQFTITQMTADLKNVQNEKQALKNDIEKVIDDYQEALLELQKQKSVDQNQKSQIDKINQQITLNEQSQVKLLDDINAKKDTIMDNQKKIKETEDTNLKLNEAIKDLQDQVKGKIENIQQLENQIALKDKQISSQSEDLAVQQSDKQEAQNKLQDLQLKFGELQKQCSDKQTVIEENKQEISDLEKHIEQIKSDHKEEIATLSEEQQKALADKDKLMKESENLKQLSDENNSKLMQDQAALKQKIKELQAALNSQMELITKYQDQLEIANEGLQKLQEELCEVKQERQTFEQTMTQDNQKKSKQIDNQTAQIQVLQELSKHQQEQIADFEKDIQGKQQQIDEKQSQYKTLNADSALQIASLKSSMSDMIQKARVDFEEKSSQQKQIEDITSKSEQQSAAIEKQKQDQIALKQENTQLCTSLTKLQSKNKELQLIETELEKQLKMLKEEVATNEKRYKAELEQEKQQMCALKDKSAKEVEQLRLRCLQDVQKAHEVSQKEGKDTLKQTKAAHQIEVDQLKQEQFQKQQCYITQIEQLQTQMKSFNGTIIYYEKIIDRVKTSLNKKLQLVGQPSGTTQSVSQLVENFKQVDKQIADLEEDNDSFTVVSNELISQYTQVLEFVSTLHFSEVSEREAKNLDLQQEIEQLSQKYEHQRQTASNISKLQGQLEEERQRDQKEHDAQRKIWEKEKKDHEATFLQKLSAKEKEKQTLKDLSQQQKERLQDKEREIEKLKQRAAEIGIKKDKLELQLNKEHEQRKKTQSELENYKIYLPEAENLLQEVNKRHQVAQKDIEQMKQRMAQEKEHYERKLSTLTQENEVYKEQIMHGKDQYEVLQERNKVLEESEANLEQQLNQLNSYQNSNKQQRDVLNSQNVQFAHQIKGLQEEKTKMMTEIALLEDHIKQREHEMRELVKTLKKFKEQKDSGDLELEALRQDVQMLQGSQNANYKIQMHMKLKDDCNRLKEENRNLFNEVQKLRRSKLAEGLEPEPASGEVPESPKLRKQFIMLISHLVSLPWIDRVITENGVFIQNVNSSQAHLEPQQFNNLLELISLLDHAICELKQAKNQVEIKYPPTVKAQQSHMLRQYQKNSSSLSKLQSERNSGQGKISSRRREPANISQSESSVFNSLAIKKPNKQSQNPHDFQTKREGYFEQRPESESSSSPQHRKDQTLSYIPESVREVSKKATQNSRHDSMAGYQSSQMQNQPLSTQNSNQKAPVETTVQAYGNQMRLDLQKIQRNQESTKTLTQRPALRSDDPGSPIILNSYSSIYKHRENSKNSKNSDSKTGISARKYQNSAVSRYVPEEGGQLRLQRKQSSKPRPMVGAMLPSSKMSNSFSEPGFLEPQPESQLMPTQTEPAGPPTSKSSLSSGKRHPQSGEQPPPHGLQKSQTMAQLKATPANASKQAMPKMGQHSSSVGRGSGQLAQQLITPVHHNQSKRGQFKQNQYKRAANSRGAPQKNYSQSNTNDLGPP